MPAHRALGQAQDFGNFGHAQAAEVTHLHHLRECGVGLCQHFERLVHAQHVGFGRGDAVGDLGVQRHVHGFTAAPLGQSGAREVDDHRAHDARGIGEEVVTVFHRQPLHAHQLEVRLVHQRRGVEQRDGLVLAQARARQAAQVVIQQAEGGARGFLVALACGGK